MASGNGPWKHGTPSSDEGGQIQNGFHSDQTSHNSSQQGDRRPPSSHRDPQRKPRKKRPQPSSEAPCDSEGKSLARDLFCGTEAPSHFSVSDHDPNQHHQGPFSHPNQPRPHSGRNVGHPGNASGQRSTESHVASKEGPGSTGSQVTSKEGQGPTRSHHSKEEGQRSEGSASKESGNFSEKSKIKRKDSKKSENYERKVQYADDSFGSEFANLKITVTEKSKPKKGAKKVEKGGMSSDKKHDSSNNKADSSIKKAESSTGKAVSSIKGAESSTEKDKLEKSTAERFINPLLATAAEFEKLDSLVPLMGSSKLDKSAHKEYDSKLDGESESTPVRHETKAGKRKKKKKKKKQNRPEVSESSQTSDSTPARPLSAYIAKEDSVTDGAHETVPESSSATPKNEKRKNEVEGQVENESSTKKADPTPPSEQKVNKNLEEMGLEQAENRLAKDLIFKLEKKSEKFPDAIYFCRACSHHLDSVAVAHRHIKEKRHKKEIKAKQKDEILKNYKTPPSAALEVLDRHLEEVIRKEMLVDGDTEERQKVVEKLNLFIKSRTEGCELVMFGSSVTVIGLKRTEINVEIVYSGELKTPTLLLELLDMLKNCDDVMNVVEDFDAKQPNISVTDKETNLVCVLSLHNSKSVLTTRLLKLYCTLEPKVVQLSKLFRLWGRYCELDKQQMGSLPPHSFTLLSLFYLQQRQSLPVLHEVMAEHDIESILTEAPGYEEVLKIVDGDWWYYPTAPPAVEKTEKVEVEEELDETTDAAESDCDLEIVFEAPTPMKVDDPETKERPLVPTKLGKCIASHTSSIGELWIKMLKFYAAEFDIENLIVTIRSESKVTRGERGWSHRRLAIEDPCSPKWNLCKAMISQSLFNFFQARIRSSLVYFLTAHEKLLNKKKGGNSKTDATFRTTTSDLKTALAELKEDSSLVTESSENDSKIDQPSESENEVSQTLDDVIEKVIEKVESSEEDETKEINFEGTYNFTKDSLMDGKAPVTICSSCKREGHRKKNCPEEVTAEIKPLPEFTSKLKHMLDTVTKECYEMFVPKEDEVRMRDLVCQDILAYLRKNYNDRVCLCLFGSSRNRFTFRGSDLDICLTFSGNETGKDLDYVEIIASLAKVLRRNSNLSSIIPITTAKVPIVKFYAPKARLEGDISLYNLLAQRNTTMLSLYATIDDRCRILGYAMKAFVKRCGIGDASRGSLSSYAYTLLVIFFLQQRDPPVLPVLQELYEGDKSPEVIVDGWNSWFYDDIANLGKVWPEMGTNKESVGELWLGMLRYYTEDFDFPRRVVAIRQKKILTAFEKEWTSKFICIEDPFDLSHNLGVGVSRRMTSFIRNVFIKAREGFGIPPKIKLQEQERWHNYFFDVEFLTDGQEVPNDRCCRVCGKIGHFVKDCPKRRTRKKLDEAKLKEIECFNCGKKGHFRKDCPEGKNARGSPVKEQLPQNHLMAPYMVARPPLMPNLMMRNMGQGSPAVHHPRRQESGHHSEASAPETPGRRQQTPKERTPKTPNKMNSNHRTTNPNNKSPFPSGNPQNIGRGQVQNQGFNRSLSSTDYESDRLADDPTIPRPSHFHPRHHQNPTKHHPVGGSPSPRGAFTVTEIEAEMKASQRFNEQRMGDNRRVVRQRSEEMMPTPSQRYPQFQGHPTPPQIRMQYSVPPMPSSSPIRPGQYMPQFSSSTQNIGNPIYPPGDYPQHGVDVYGRTPPSTRPPFHPMPGNVNYPQHPQRHQGDQHRFRAMTPERRVDAIQSRTFVNSERSGARREVHFTSPDNSGYHSYPPGPGQPPNWGGRNM